MGANSTIICGNTIGKHAFIGAGAVVTKDVQDYALMVGVPAQRAGWVCECGQKLSDEQSELSCGKCDRKYSYRNKGKDEIVEISEEAN